MHHPAPGAGSLILGKLAAPPQRCLWHRGTRRSRALSRTVPPVSDPARPECPQTAKEGARDPPRKALGPGASEKTERFARAPSERVRVAQVPGEGAYVFFGCINAPAQVISSTFCFLEAKQGITCYLFKKTRRETCSCNL